MLLRPASLALAMSLALGAPAALASPPPAPIAAEHLAATPSASAGSEQDNASYALREQQDHKIADYEGGSIVVIGISTGTLIVLLILILLLA